MVKKNTSIQLKAAFLLTIFTLNIVVGFACAIGMDMGFNIHHQHDEGMESMEHVHADGSKHVHNSQTGSHHHDESENQKSKEDTDNCCKDKVTKLAQADKSVPQGYSSIHPVFLTAFLTSFYNINLFPRTTVVKDIKHFVRGYHPPIPDIRVAIQSFQI
jgi:hypothetical protein